MRKYRHNLDYSVSHKRFAEMEWLMSELQTEMCKLKKIYCEKYQLFEAEDIVKQYFFLLVKRLQTHGVRSYLIYKTAQYIANQQQRQLSADEQQTVKQLAFIAEAIITIQYLHNQIIDKKAKVTDNAAIRKNIIASNVLRELLFDYITTMQFIDKNNKKKIEKTVGKIFLLVDMGQSMELNYGHYSAFKKNSFSAITDSSINHLFDDYFGDFELVMVTLLSNVPQEHHIFLQLYFRRIFLTNVALCILLTEINCTLLKEANSNVSRFAVIYGFLFQIVNDVADIIPIEGKETIGKNENDVFSDLKNQNITLPLFWHLLKAPRRLVYRYLENPVRNQYIVEYFQKEILLELRDSGAIDICIQIGRDLAKIAGNLLNPNNPATLFLKDLLTIGYWNIYYKKIHKNYGTKQI
ncbi:MAG: hypothetical protein JNM36_13545 [Chitinophagales bacterium]|nr:hypothetical protein [Chitinophagales bacterium]